MSIIGRATLSGIKTSAQTLLKWSPTCQQQVAGIMNKALRDLDNTRPEPYPYHEKRYNIFRSWFDKTSWRFDENSKIIVVDGPVAAGKDELAMELATKLDMVYIPHAHLDRYYVNSIGYDTRQINNQCAEYMHSFDIDQFLANPTDSRTPTMQTLMMMVKVAQYIDALGHVLSTGQGVVMNRSIYSDFIFVDTLAKFGMIRKPVQSYYYENMEITLPRLMRPHLCIYLDIPVDEVIKRVQKRNLPGEKNSPFYKPEVLRHMETLYKDRYLKDISSHSEVLIYDWTEKGDVDIVAEDCERAKVDVDDYGIHDPKMCDWRLPNEPEWGAKRMEYTTYRKDIEMWLNHIPVYDCPELGIKGQDYWEWRTLLENAPGYIRPRGFNVEAGDKGVWTRLKEPIRTTTSGPVFE